MIAGWKKWRTVRILVNGKLVRVMSADKWKDKR